MNSRYPEEEEFNSDNEYDPMKMQQGQGIPHLADGGILDDENQIPASFPPKQPPMPPKLPGMPQGVTPDALQPFLGAQKASLNKFGPDKQFAVEQALTASRRGVGPSIANAGAGFADALMQGVARAGPGNFQANMQNRQDKMISEVSGSYDKLRTGKAEQMKTEMELANEDPSTPQSKIAQRTERPTLLQLGFTDEEIGQMPASLIAAATTRAISAEDARNKLVLGKATIEQTGSNARLTAGLRGKEIENDAEREKRLASEAEIERKLKMKSDATKTQQDAVKTLEGVGGPGFWGGVSGTIRKGIADVPVIGNKGLAATKRLAAGESEPTQVNSQEEYDALPSGTAYIDSEGNQATKR